MEQFYIGGQIGYVQPGTSGLYVQDDMGDAVVLIGDPLFNFVEFAIDRVVIASEVAHTA